VQTEKKMWLLISLVFLSTCDLKSTTTQIEMTSTATVLYCTFFIPPHANKLNYSTRMFSNKKLVQSGNNWMNVIDTLNQLLMSINNNLNKNNRTSSTQYQRCTAKQCGSQCNVWLLASTNTHVSQLEWTPLSLLPRPVLPFPTFSA